MKMNVQLPLEIQWKILNYIHHPQPLQLREDIQDFIKSRQLLLQYYHTFKNIVNCNEDVHIFVINDLLYFINEEQFLYRGFTPFFRQCFQQLCCSRHLSTWFDQIFLQKNTISQLNILWGVLTPNERKQFFDIYC